MHCGSIFGRTPLCCLFDLSWCASRATAMPVLKMETLQEDGGDGGQPVWRWLRGMASTIIS